MNMMIGANFAFFSLPIAPCFFKKKNSAKKFKLLAVRFLAP